MLLWHICLFLLSLSCIVRLYDKLFVYLHLIQLQKYDYLLKKDNNHGKSL